MMCTPGRHGRTVRDRHTDTCQGGTCTGCLPCTEPHCTTCHRTHAETTCAACLSMARHNLAQVAAMTHRLPDEAGDGRQALHTGTGIPGGDALVLLAPGNTKAQQHGQLLHRRTCGLDTTHLQDEHTGDPRPPLAVLTAWAYAWHAHTRQPNTLPTTVADAVAYLDQHLHHMARTHLFPLLARDLTNLAHRLEDVLHDGYRPEVSRVPCWECGTRLVKQYGQQPTDDHWLCPHCKERYDRGRYDRAKHDHLASEGAERYVLLTDAVAAVGRSVKTVRTWMDRGLVSARRDPTTGRVFVWWPDVRVQHLEAAARRSRRQVQP